MEEKTIVCACGQSFAFTEGEQKFYEEKGFEPPKRCPACRAKRRQEREKELSVPTNDGRWEGK